MDAGFTMTSGLDVRPWTAKVMPKMPSLPPGPVSRSPSNRNAPKEIVDAIKRNIGSGKRKNLTVEVDPPLPRHAKLRPIERGIVDLKFGGTRRERHDHAVEHRAFAGQGLLAAIAGVGLNARLFPLGLGNNPAHNLVAHDLEPPDIDNAGLFRAAAAIEVHPQVQGAAPRGAPDAGEPEDRARVECVRGQHARMSGLLLHMYRDRRLPIEPPRRLKVGELAAAPFRIDDHRLQGRVVIAEYRFYLDIQVEPRLVLERRWLTFHFAARQQRPEKLPAIVGRPLRHHLEHILRRKLAVDGELGQRVGREFREAEGRDAALVVQQKVAVDIQAVSGQREIVEHQEIIRALDQIEGQRGLLPRRLAPADCRQEDIGVGEVRLHEELGRPLPLQGHREGNGQIALDDVVHIQAQFVPRLIVENAGQAQGRLPLGRCVVNALP